MQSKQTVQAKKDTARKVGGGHVVASGSFLKGSPSGTCSPRSSGASGVDPSNGSRQQDLQAPLQGLDRCLRPDSAFGGKQGQLEQSETRYDTLCSPFDVVLLAFLSLIIRKLTNLSVLRIRGGGHSSQMSLHPLTLHLPICLTSLFLEGIVFNDDGKSVQLTLEQLPLLRCFAMTLPGSITAIANIAFTLRQTIHLQKLRVRMYGRTGTGGQ